MSGKVDQQREKAAAAKLEALRNLMTQHSLQALIVPTADVHQSEYVGDQDKRRAWLSGFDGSAGTAVVTTVSLAASSSSSSTAPASSAASPATAPAAGSPRALLWTDGRYFLQADMQLTKDWTLMKQGMEGVPSTTEWLFKNLPPRSKVGIDGSLLPYASYRSMVMYFKDQLELVLMKENLVDMVWGRARPPAPSKPLILLPESSTGLSSAQKLELVRKEFQQEKKEENVHALILTALDEIAWLFNLRGSDISFNPVFLSYAVITPTTATLYVDAVKLTDPIRAYLQQTKVTIKPYEDVFKDLKALPREGKIWLDGSKCNMAVTSVFLSPPAAVASASATAPVPVPLSSSIILDRASPIVLMKAIKNSVELAGMREAHLRDAAAVVNFLAWLEHNIHNEEPYLTEVSVANKLEDFRRQQKDFVSLSFETISAAGPNGAIIHYKPEPDTARRVTCKEMFLLDSGAQYLCGTTDITRTIHMGTPTDYEKLCFTRVLQGHIGLATAVFPPKTAGPTLDAYARRPLWSEGLDYLHGTGHGIGAFLNVHEGPHGISSTIREGSTAHSTPLVPGMLVSNEPGYYEEGRFGIRIESIVAVEPATTNFHFNNRQYYSFETITLVPIQTSLIDISLLTQQEIDWLNSYHARCRSSLSGRVQGLAFDWLIRNTQPISKASR